MVVGAATRVLARPCPALRRSVVSYVGFRQHGFAPGIHRGAPGRSLTLVVPLAEPLDIVEVAGCTARQGRFEAVVGGLSSTAVAIRHDGNQYGVRISLTPLGARALFGMPSAGLAGEVLHLDAVLGRRAVELTERMRAARSWDERFTVLDDVLVRAAQDRSAGRARDLHLQPEVAEAWRRLLSSRGAIRIGHLADELGWSRRHLGRRFRDEIGLTPKEAARVLRFEHAHALATSDVELAWSHIATATGFADQAHLVRDWRDFTGCTPTEWRRGETLAH